MFKWLNKLQSKNIEKITYNRYRIIVNFIDGSIKKIEYINYYSGDGDEMLKCFLGGNKKDMIIIGGVAYSISQNIKSIQSEIVGTMYGYWDVKAPLSTGLCAWMTEEELIYNNEKYKDIIKLIK